PRAGDDIGRIVDPPPECTHEVAIRLAVGVGHTVVEVRGADLGERRRRLEPRRRELDVRESRRPLDLGGLESEVLPRSGGRRAYLIQGRLLVLEAPAPELQLTSC